MFVWDQRMVYNHAMLALTGLDVGVAMLDVDEYVSGAGGGLVWLDLGPV